MNVTLVPVHSIYNSEFHLWV